MNIKDNQDYCTNHSLNGTTLKSAFHALLDVAFKDNEYIKENTMLTRIANTLILTINTLSHMLSYFGLGIFQFIFGTIAFYYAYKIFITPYNRFQDLNLPGQTDARREIVNHLRRCRKLGKKMLPPYPNGWFVVLESEELKNGGVKRVECLGEHFVVFRTYDGKAHIADAHCPHLGANFGIGGRIHENCLECPFHLWRFDAESGKCVSIPNCDTVPKGVAIKLWPCTEVNGFIHVWYDAENRSPFWSIPEMKQVKRPVIAYHGRSDFLITCHLKDIIENAGDMAHFTAIHIPNVFSGRNLPGLSWLDKLASHDWDGRWETTDEDHISIMTQMHTTKLFNKFSIKIKVTAIQMGPGISQIIFNHRFLEFYTLQYATPLEPMLQRATLKIYAPWYIRPLAKFFIFGESVMFHRDVVVWNFKEYLHTPIYSKTDKYLKSSRKWFEQFYSENSVPFKDAIMGPKKNILDF